MQQGRGKRLGVQAQLAKYACYCEGVGNVRFAGLPELPGMGALTEEVRVLKLRNILPFKVAG
jgi:hypothetical protein